MAVNLREHLTKAERHIAECKAHITHERQAIEEARNQGRFTEISESFLRVLEDCLKNYEKHRQLIMDRMGD